LRWYTVAIEDCFFQKYGDKVVGRSEVLCENLSELNLVGLGLKLTEKAMAVERI